MNLKLPDESSTTPPQLTLFSLPRHKPLPEPVGMVTPPFQPMVSVPFQWEEEPGRPKPTSPSSPFKPNNVVRCLNLPADIPTESTVVYNMPLSPTTVLHGPSTGRSMSHGLFGPNKESLTTSMGLDHGDGNEYLRAHRKIGRKDHLEIPEWEGGNLDVDVQVKITRFRRSRGSLYRLKRKSSHLLEGIYESLKQMVALKSKKTPT